MEVFRQDVMIHLILRINNPNKDGSELDLGQGIPILTLARHGGPRPDLNQARLDSLRQTRVVVKY